MDDILFDLVIARLQQLRSKPSAWFVSATRDPDRPNALIYETEAGSLRGTVSERNGAFVFQFGAIEVVVAMEVFFGKAH